MTLSYKTKQFCKGAPGRFVYVCKYIITESLQPILSNSFHDDVLREKGGRKKERERKKRDDDIRKIFQHWTNPRSITASKGYRSLFPGILEIPKNYQKRSYWKGRPTSRKLYTACPEAETLELRGHRGVRDRVIHLRLQPPVRQQRLTRTQDSSRWRYRKTVARRNGQTASIETIFNIDWHDKLVVAIRNDRADYRLSRSTYKTFFLINVQLTALRIYTITHAIMK